jgi:hypothetical protein
MRRRLTREAAYTVPTQQIVAPSTAATMPHNVPSPSAGPTTGATINNVVELSLTEGDDEIVLDPDDDASRVAEVDAVVLTDQLCVAVATTLVLRGAVRLGICDKLGDTDDEVLSLLVPVPLAVADTDVVGDVELVTVRLVDREASRLVLRLGLLLDDLLPEALAEGGELVLMEGELLAGEEGERDPVREAVMDGELLLLPDAVLLCVAEEL